MSSPLYFIVSWAYIYGLSTCIAACIPVLFYSIMYVALAGRLPVCKFSQLVDVWVGFSYITAPAALVLILILI